MRRWGLLSKVQEQQAVCKQLTDAGVELHGDDGALVALVLPRAVAELSDPALGRPVRGPAVHQPVYHQDADHRVRVPVHRLVRGRAIHKSSDQTLGIWTHCQKSVGWD